MNSIYLDDAKDGKTPGKERALEFSKLNRSFKTQQLPHAIEFGFTTGLKRLSQVEEIRLGLNFSFAPPWAVLKLKMGKLQGRRAFLS